MSYSIASIIERIVDILIRKGRELATNSKTILNKILIKIMCLRDIIPREDKIVSIIKSIGLYIQKIQSSLEDSLSVLSLLLELLISLSMIMVLVIVWWRS